MRTVRSRALISAGFALWCQLFVVGTPIAQNIVAAMHEEPAETECVCHLSGHAGAMCPMHHSPAKKKSTAPSDARCSIGQTDSSLAGLVFATGSLPEPPMQLAIPIEHGMPLVRSLDRLLARSTSLDPPPPRS